ncbi:restriction endonuclease subunit S [Mammaliicoccus sciuri]|uniref:restriction endonuclease subunit S n=1 Tax=Mammaliicoccus sciuri TaxID=1296 RepID=UPI001FB47E62|nr:restriction endonuclease subunit S [Mammaliicoccus sciuri]MCJ1761401.1 restriction endonuclease subunit S [Mammaliicoccus sciuri]
MTNQAKNVPELRFPEFEGEWENSKLGTVANVYDGTHQTPKYTSEGIKFLSVENIKTLNSNKFISKEAFEKEFKIRPEFGDVLMTRIGDVGTPNVVETNEYLAYYVSLALLKPKKLNSYFLESLIRSQSVQNELWRKTLHIAFPKKINKNEIAKVEINYPEQQEQQKIGEFFSKLDRQIELEEQKLAKLEEQKKGYMQRIFSQELRFKDENGNEYPEWKEKTLMQIAKVKTGTKNVQDNIANGAYKFFDRSVEIKYLNTFDFDETAIIYPGEGSKFLPRLFSGKYSLHQRAYSIFDVKVNNYYLFYYLSLQNNHFLKYAVGSTVKSLRMSGFEKLKVLVPETAEQEKIGGFFKQIDNFIDKQSIKIESLKECKQGLLQKMFI